MASHLAVLRPLRSVFVLLGYPSQETAASGKDHEGNKRRPSLTVLVSTGAAGWWVHHQESSVERVVTALYVAHGHARGVFLLSQAVAQSWCEPCDWKWWRQITSESRHERHARPSQLPLSHFAQAGSIAPQQGPPEWGPPAPPSALGDSSGSTLLSLQPSPCTV